MINKIIHIAQDEKFINSGYIQFESAFPEKNFFYIFIADKEAELKFVLQKKNVFKFQSNIDLDDFISGLKGNEIFVFHSLSTNFYNLILKLPQTIKCIWICFGYEIYSDRRFYNETFLLDTITKSRFGTIKISSKEKLKEKIRPYKRIFHRNLQLSSLEIKRIIFKRINFLASPFMEERDAILKLINLKMKPFSFWYYPIELIVTINEPIASDRVNILIGHSGFTNGNHLDIFNKIKAYDFHNKKIIVPLSYGDINYIPTILDEGKLIFKNKFHPLTDFMPLYEYNEILKKCGIAILNNRRQQAIGNIIALLWYGSKVFLSDKNSFYHYLKRIGVVVFCYEKELNSAKDLELLSFEKIRENRKQLFKHLNTELLLSELKHELEML